MPRRTFIDEIQDPVTGEIHRIEAATEAELDAAIERYVASLEGGQSPVEDADGDVQRAPSDPSEPPVDPQQPTNPA